MRPLDRNTVEIPLTFDVASGITPLTDRRVKFGIIIVVLICVGGLLLGIISGSVTIFLACIGLIFVATTIFRFIYFNESYYKKKYSELKTRGFIYDSNLIWDIYEIAPGFPICSYKNGTKAVFVTFDKDIIVGKPDNNEYLHYEAISEAYNVISKKNIECMHIDYMDTVGKDERLEPVIKQLLKTPNADLRQLLSVVFDYQQYNMSRSYSSYDVFAFFYKYNDDEFKDDLESIVNCFMEANYVRFRLLGVAQLRELAKSIYNLVDFSVYNACDNVFKINNTSRFVKVISTELDGVTTVINRTSAEVAAARQEQVRRNNAAMAARYNKRGKGGQLDDAEEVDLFNMEETTPSMDDMYEQDDTFAYLDEADILGDFASSSPDLVTGHYAHEEAYAVAHPEEMYDEPYAEPSTAEDLVYADFEDMSPAQPSYVPAPNNMPVSRVFARSPRKVGQTQMNIPTQSQSESTPNISVNDFGDNGSPVDMEEEVDLFGGDM